MLVTLTSSAELDVAEAALTYELERAGLGSRFDHEFDGLLKRIAESPLQFPILEGEVRRALIRNFPFGVFFVVQSDRVSVIAVLHLHRHPDTWKSRR